MRKSTALITLLVVGLASLGWWSWNQSGLRSREITTLRLSLDDKVESLDPAKAYSDDSLFISSQVMEPLYQYHYLKRPYEIEPLVADGVPQILEKGKVVRVHIKRNVYYHPHPAFGGKRRELKAEDFVTQFKRLALPSLKSPGRGLFSGLLLGFDEYSALVSGSWEKIFTTPLEGVRALDEHTLELRMRKSEPNISYYLALNFLSPVPAELVKYENNNLDRTLVGTGPYRLTGYNGQYISMDKNPDYRPDFYPTSGDRYANVERLLDSSKERIPFIDHLQFFITGNESERWKMFFNREIDIVTVPKPFLPRVYTASGELTEDLKRRGIVVKHFPTLANRWLAFNMRDPLVGKNENLRRAIAYAIDYTRYIQLLSQNTNLRANSILVPGISGYLPAKEFRFRYDPVLAREYLKKAGFSDPLRMPTITYSTRGNQEVNLLEARFIREQLENIGLNVNVQILTFSEFLSKGRAGELMFFTDNWLFDYPDGENILQLLVSTNFPGINKSAYSNPRVDALYLKLKETTNLDSRDEIIHEMEEIVFRDLPWIPMMYESSFVLSYPEVKNFRKSSIIRNYIKYLKVEK